MDHHNRDIDQYWCEEQDGGSHDDGDQADVVSVVWRHVTYFSNVAHVTRVVACHVRDCHSGGCHLAIRTTHIWHLTNAQMEFWQNSNLFYKIPLYV